MKTKLKYIGSLDDQASQDAFAIVEEYNNCTGDKDKLQKLITTQVKKFLKNKEGFVLCLEKLEIKDFEIEKLSDLENFSLFSKPMTEIREHLGIPPKLILFEGPRFDNLDYPPEAFIYRDCWGNKKS